MIGKQCSYLIIGSNRYYIIIIYISISNDGVHIEKLLCFQQCFPKRWSDMFYYKIYVVGLVGQMLYMKPIKKEFM